MRPDQNQYNDYSKSCTSSCTPQTPPYPTTDGAACGRMSSRELLNDRIQKAYRIADQLRALSNALPLILPPDADDALYLLLQASL